jgi:hypothetical protein
MFDCLNLVIAHPHPWEAGDGRVLKPLYKDNPLKKYKGLA